MVRRKLRQCITMMCYETGVVARSRKARWCIKDELARCATWDGKLRFSTIKVIGVEK